MAGPGAAPLPNALPPYRTFLASDAEIREILRDCRTIAVLGMGADPLAVRQRQALEQRGYRVLPAAAGPSAADGTVPAPPLTALGERADIVLVLAGAEDVGAAAREAAGAGARVLWLGRGVLAPEAAYRASRGGLQVVMGRDLLDEYMMHFPDDEIGYPSGEPRA